MGPNRHAIAGMVLQDVKEKAMSLERIKLLPVQDAMFVLRRTASAALNYITQCGTPDEVRPASAFFDNKVAELVRDIQRLQKSELTAEVIDEIFSPLLMGGTGIVATEPVTAAGIPFLASIAMALPTMRGILGDEKAFLHTSRALLKNSGSNILSWEGLTQSRPQASPPSSLRGHRKVRKEDIGERPTGKVGGYPT